MGTGLRLQAQHSDGDMFPVEVSLSPITVDGEVQTIATVRDVSERQEALSQIALFEDRERIAHDLHDLVIQRLLAVGMSLQSVLGLVDSPVVRERISTATDDLDETVRELRSTIFRLGRSDTERSLPTQLAELVDERSRHLGFRPDLRIDGEIDDLPDFVAQQLVATLTEGLSNMVRHAGASDATIVVTRRDGELQLVISDNGSGISSTPKPLGGVSNMMWRAAELGGWCSVGSGDPHGTRLEWRVPV